MRGRRAKGETTGLSVLSHYREIANFLAWFATTRECETRELSLLPCCLAASLPRCLAAMSHPASRRYRAGAIPTYAKGLIDPSEVGPSKAPKLQHQLLAQIPLTKQPTALPPPTTTSSAVPSQPTSQAPRAATADSRLSRLQRATQEKGSGGGASRRHASSSDDDDDDDDDDNAARARRRRPIEATVIMPAASQSAPAAINVEESKQQEERTATQAQSESESEEDEDEVARRRELLRQRLRARREEEEKEQGLGRHGDDDDGLRRDGTDEEDEKSGSSSEEDDDDDSDSDDDESDSDGGGFRRPVMAPVFVKKELRDTILEKQRIEQEKELAAELERQRLEERAQESQQMALERIKAAAQEIKEAIQRGEELDEDENMNDADEYAAWQQRELARIKRDKDEREAMERERQDTEARRLMSDAEIRAQNPERFTKDRSKMNFLQKSYHKGSFFQDELQKTATEKGWDWNAATGEDRIDKKILPSVMQVKNFGRKGRTKYTHLADQDTTDRSALWAQDQKLKSKYLSKLGGVHGGNEALHERPPTSPSSAGNKRKRD